MIFNVPQSPSHIALRMMIPQRGGKFFLRNRPHHLLRPHHLACWKKVLFAINEEKNKDGGEGKHGSILVSFMNIPSMDPALKRVECLYKDIQKT